MGITHRKALPVYVTKGTKWQYLRTLGI